MLNPDTLLKPQEINQKIDNTFQKLTSEFTLLKEDEQFIEQLFKSWVYFYTKMENFSGGESSIDSLFASNYLIEWYIHFIQDKEIIRRVYLPEDVEIEINDRARKSLRTFMNFCRRQFSKTPNTKDAKNAVNHLFGKIETHILD